MQFDASLLDWASTVAGVLSYIIHKFTRSARWFDPRLLADFANGLAVPPIIMLMGSTLASGLLDQIKVSSRITLLIAGAAALFALFDPRRSGVVASRLESHFFR